MRALVLAALLLAAPASGRELGTMPVSGQMALEWLAIEDDGEGGFTGRYRARGGTDGADGEETLLGGFDLACRGTIRVIGVRVVADEAACRATDRHGNAIWLDLSAEPGPWEVHRLAVQVGEGTGIYARLSGTGTVTRVMHLAPTSAGPWGFLAGSIVWQRR